ncbi:MAG: gamma-glutamyltransferase [Rhizobiaceae bacterium]
MQLTVNPAFSQTATDAIAPEITTAVTVKNNGKPVSGKKWMVSIANPHAALAARMILKGGGNAIDAAITAQFVLGLVEPQSSGLGGGAFLVYFDAKTKEIVTLDGRETAPLAATPQLFQNQKGEPLKFFDAVVGGRSVGTPGTPALLWEMHTRWGATPWQKLIMPALLMSERGFIVSQRLAALVKKNAKTLSYHPATAAYFLPNSTPIMQGQLLQNNDYANTLRSLHDSNSVKPFYHGSIAKSIVATVREFIPNSGVLSSTDLSSYRIKQRPPVCGTYRSHQVCGMGPPSSGALTVGQILGMLQPFDLKSLGPKSPTSWRLIGDASRLAFADRGRYMADSDYVPMPTKGLLKPSYLRTRSSLLQADKALETIAPGKPEWDHAQLQADDEAIELPSTTHFSIVDQDGNAVSMTSTIENGFGSRLMVGGFLLNNELTDFSFRTHRDGYPIANRIEPGKRPRSSMAPTIVLKNKKPVLIIGSPGGSRIIGYVAKTIIAHLDWEMDIQKAISLPHLVNRFGTYDLEAGTQAEALKPELEALGYTVRVLDLNSGLHGIAIKPDHLEGGADPRREGIVLAE